MADPKQPQYPQWPDWPDDYVITPENAFDNGHPGCYHRIPENPAVVDFTGCGSVWDFHVILQTSLGLPDYYGKNMDALYDVMWGFRGYPLTVEVRGLDTLPAEFGRQITMLKGVFTDVHRDWPNLTFVYGDTAQMAVSEARANFVHGRVQTEDNT